MIDLYNSEQPGLRPFKERQRDKGRVYSRQSCSKLSTILTVACLGLGVGIVWPADFVNAAIGDDPAILNAPASSGVAAVNSGEIARPIAPPAQKPISNPLWAIPLSSLTATRERPIFNPSRRPPAPVVAGPPPAAPVAPAPVPAGPPKLTLIGAVVGTTESIAVFLDPSREAIRLRAGEDYGGWMVNSIMAREVVLQKDKESVVFALPAPGDTPVPPGGIGSTVSPPPLAAASIPGPVESFAPFVPRHTPKNGEHDGL